MSHHHSQPERWKPHKDWRVILGAVVMLIAMIIYVLSLDEAFVPNDLPVSQPNASAPAQQNP